MRERSYLRRNKLKAIRDSVNSKAEKVFRKEATRRSGVKPMQNLPKPTQIVALSPKPAKYQKYRALQEDKDINPGKSYAEYRKDSKAKSQDAKANLMARLKMEKAARDEARGKTLLKVLNKSSQNRAVSLVGTTWAF